MLLWTAADEDRKSPKTVEDKPDNSVNLIFGLFVLLSEPHLLANLTISLGHMSSN